MAPPSERRKHPRIDVDIPVEVRAGERSCSGRVVDLSQGGLCLKLGESLSVQGTAIVRLELGDDDVAAAEARVQWQSGRGVGLQLTEPSERFQRFLTDLVEIRPVLRPGLVKGIRAATIMFAD